jgi:hypothetical protein
MKVSGFTFIKNAIVYDYPVVEAIQSILPICDEVVVAVGKSDDDTRDLIASIHPTKIKIIDTVWDENLREGGRVLALETDKAFAAISQDSDWAFYIQGDEVVHEQYLPEIKAAMERHLHDDMVDGLLFNYLHFYGSYDYVGASANWYSHEIRVVKNKSTIFSFRDAQGFRKKPDTKLKVVPIEAYMYHYGWVKPPEAMQKKQENFNKYWHDDKWVDQNVEKVVAFDYAKHVRELKRFNGSHPEVIKKRIASKNWEFNHDISVNNLSIKDRLKAFLKTRFGLDFGYKNYVRIKPKK